MNKRQAKKAFRKVVCTMPYGRKTKSGIWKKKATRKWEKEFRRWCNE